MRTSPPSSARCSAPGDQVEVDRWDRPLVTLAAPDHVAAFLRVHGMSDAAAQSAATLDLPLA
ncbi:MAG: hypothetical protein ABJB47_03470 [Actinomycetota bacterium]